MRLLWLSHFIPYPPVGGARQRSYQLLRHVAASYEISLIAFNLLNEPADRLAGYQGELQKCCARVEFWTLPVKWKGTCWWTELAMSPLKMGPLACRSFWNDEISKRWEQALKEHPGALLHLDSPDLAFFAKAADGFRKVLNHHNCESAMAERRAQLEPNPIKRFYLRDQAIKLREVERVICDQFDVNTTVSAGDRDLLRIRNPRAHIHIVENGTDTTFFQPGGGPVESSSVIFAASLNWYPNVSAVRFFREEIWPLLKHECEDARFYLAGKSPPKWMTQWAAHERNVTLVLSPADMRPWLDRAAVYVCPIVDGGGTRLKILDAMAMGKPVVTTTVGCEGLHVNHGENIIVADSPREFASAIRELWEDTGLRERIAAAGRALVEREYCWRSISSHLKQAYDCALNPASCQERFSPAAPTYDVSRSSAIERRPARRT